MVHRLERYTDGKALVVAEGNKASGKGAVVLAMVMRSNLQRYDTTR